MMSQKFFAKIRDLSHKGMGVLDGPDGIVYFSRGTWPGDEGYFVAENFGTKYSEAKCVEFTKLSEDRVEVVCPHRGIEIGKCGGCPWMIASYKSQIKFKLERLKHYFFKEEFTFLKIK